VSVHGWSVHIHEWCLYSIHVRVRTVPENTCCLYRQRDRPFFFWPVILTLFLEAGHYEGDEFINGEKIGII
jgi:hypothetical protein